MQGLWAALRREPNCTSLLLTLGIVACISTLTWCHTSQDVQVHPTETCGDRTWMAAVLALSVLSMWYIADSCLCKANANLYLPRVSAEEVMARVQHWRRAVPSVWWRAEAYHYQQRRRRPSRNHCGEVDEVPVNSNSVTRFFCYRQYGVGDISKDLQLSPRGPVTIIRFSKGFTFTNSVVEADYEEQRRSFVAENKPLDQFLEMHEGMEVDRFHDEELMVACGDRLWWLHTLPAFWIASFALLSWPLQILCLSRTAYVDYEVIKIFGIDYVESPTTSGNSNGVGQEDGTRDGVYVVPCFTHDLVWHSPEVCLHGRTVTTPTEDPHELPTLVVPPLVTRTLLDMETTL